MSGVQNRAPLLFLTVLIIATAGLVYELLAGAIATTVLGNSLRQYSITIGVYLFAMGVGAYLSKFIEQRIAQRFVDIELAAALIGGTQGLLLYLAYVRADAFGVLLYGTLTISGILVGLEIPLLMRILRDDLDFKDLVAKVLTFDYLGALIGSLVFSIVLVEMLMIPLERIGILFGLLNCAVGLMSTWVLREHIYPRGRLQLRLKGLLVGGILVLALVYSTRLRIVGEQGLYPERIVHVEQSPYQRIVLTSDSSRLSLYIDGNLQFTSMDEYRYHESLVHPAMADAPSGARVLVLGGGDGLAARELLRYPDLGSVTLVDLDPAITDLARTLPGLRTLNGDALADARIEVINDDAMVWLDEARPGAIAPFDVVIVDFPDPNNFSLGKLYTRRFYRLVREVMKEDAALVVQSTAPLIARKRFWCVERTIASVGLHTVPYHVSVPSFGEWGYVMARRTHFEPPARLRADVTDGLRFLDDAMLPGLFTFPRDMAPVEVELNRLNHQVLVHYYSAEWAQVN